MICRRSLLSRLGACAAGAFGPLSATTRTQPAPQTRVVVLESFCVVDTGKMPLLGDYLGDALLPFLRDVRNCTGICLDAIVAPHTPQALLLTAYSSFDEMLDVRSRIAAHPRIRQSRADLESAHILGEVQSQILTGAECLRFPAGSERVATGIFELRAYHAPAWADGPPARVNSIFRRAGIRPILNGATAAGEHLPRFTYLIPFENLAARQQAWSRLDRDSEWIDIQRESVARHSGAATVTAKSIYQWAPYSRLA